MKKKNSKYVEKRNGLNTDNKRKQNQNETKTGEDSMLVSATWRQPCNGGVGRGYNEKRMCNKGELRNEKSTCHERYRNSENIFSENTHWIVFTLTLFIRINYVSDKKNWWILHPDEIFQSLEIAHSELYGYGFRPYEYMPPPDDANITSGSVSNTQEYKLGMYSLRSFMFPTVFTVIGKTAILFGWQKSPYIIWKIFHATVTSCLPLSVYRFVMVTYASHDTATMASIFVAFSVHMNVFGTHTFINSFLSPILFYTLSDIMKIILTSQPKTQKTEYSSDEEIPELYYSLPENRDVSSEIKTHQVCISEKRIDQNKNCENNIKYKDYGQIFETAKSNFQNTQFEQRNIYCRNTNGGKVINIKHLRNSKLKIVSGYPFRLFFTGLFFGMAVYIRIDSCLLLFFWFLPYLSTVFRNCRRIFKSMQAFTAGSSIGVGICMCDDVFRYNAWVLSVWQWLNFNVIKNVSSKLFGTKTVKFYFQEILFHDISMCLLFIFAVLYLILSIVKERKLILGHVGALGLKASIIDRKLCFTISVLLIIYSLRGHKELRFLHDTVVILLVFYSSVIIHVCHAILRNVTCVKQTTVIWTVIVFYIASQWSKFPSYTDKTNADWSYGKSSDSNYVNICLNFLSEQHDVRGVYIDASIYETGGYTILHHDVPIISLIHKEFYEFGSDSRIILGKKNRKMLSNDTLSLATLRKISDFISVKNTQYLLKVLIKKPVYNYLIIENEREFLKHGYSEVFRSGTMRVLKRNFQPEQEVYLRRVAANIPPGPDVLTLNYEANWLLTYALYDKAEHKLLYSLKIDNKNLQTYQLLVRVYQDQRKTEKAKKMQSLCKQYCHSNKCDEQPDRIVIHKEYDFELDI